MLQISAVIITLNEEQRLPRALESLALAGNVADEILVVDSGSTDGTQQIAERHGARFLVHPWEGYARQKNYAASQAQHDWVLSLDADEALSLELAEELKRLKKEGTGDTAGFRMPRMAYYRGRWIRHSGWYPDCKLRLYDRRRGRWVGDYVHEHVETDGPVGKLHGDLHHFTCDSFEENRARLDRYTTLAAREAFDQGTRSVWLGMLAGPPWKFLESYLVRQGFRDGYPGLVIAVMAARYVFLKYAKLGRMMRDDRQR